MSITKEETHLDKLVLTVLTATTSVILKATPINPARAVVLAIVRLGST